MKRNCAPQGRIIGATNQKLISKMNHARNVYKFEMHDFHHATMAPGDALPPLLRRVLSAGADHSQACTFSH